MQTILLWLLSALSLALDGAGTMLDSPVCRTAWKWDKMTIFLNIRCFCLLHCLYTVHKSNVIATLAEMHVDLESSFLPLINASMQAVQYKIKENFDLL